MDGNARPGDDALRHTHELPASGRHGVAAAFMPCFANKQSTKRTFCSYMLASLHASRTASMPIFYHLA